MTRLPIFVSSVQKELEAERLAVSSLIATDPFLLRHCEPVLFEREPLPPHPEPQPYLAALRRCAVYLLIIAREYGSPDGELSATHHEYRLAQELKLPTLVFIRGAAADERDRRTQALIDEIRTAKHTFRRFLDREDLKPEVRRALVRVLAEDFGIGEPPPEAEDVAQPVDRASPFESCVLPDVSAGDFGGSWLGQFTGQVLPGAAASGNDGAVRALAMRGLATFHVGTWSQKATNAAFLLFGERPADRYPQAEVLLDACDGDRITGRPRAQLNLNAALPDMITQALEFIDRQTEHPRRVVGISNLRLDEYPVRALREALVNAAAHRDYGDAARKTAIRIFRNRLEIASPGYVPRPLTLARLMKGDYQAASRNPLIARTLATLRLMEQRGSGFERMREAMLNHGLDEPRYAQQDGFFVVTFPGPDGDYNRLRVPADASGLVPPAVTVQLNPRQKRILLRVQKQGSVTSGWCRTAFGVSYNTAFLDLRKLVRLGLLVQAGDGRSTRYELKVR